MKERLQKILSGRGVASRRKAEEMITRGLVTVNGVTASLGDTADPQTDVILVEVRHYPRLDYHVVLVGSFRAEKIRKSLTRSVTVGVDDYEMTV